VTGRVQPSDRQGLDSDSLRGIHHVHIAPQTNICVEELGANTHIKTDFMVWKCQESCI
jgi:hypothetical protein